ncbi:MAG TPA: BldC family transcriptional regulator [Nocardioidaceae bacterium]|jgi:excisionase family DNA binding protein
MSPQTLDYEKLLTPAEVARAFRVDPKTVTRWADKGHLKPVRLPSGHRRFRESDVTALLHRAEDQA